MTFEEFFKKKKIHLSALQAADAGLFSEFSAHYLQMGEKSFDHTKKYWFNKLRRLYPLPPDVKPEKIRFENQLAEQTITETLADEALPAGNPAYKRRLKVDEIEKAVKANTESLPPVAEQPTAAPTPQTPAAPLADAPKPAYKPKFKAAVKPAAVEAAPSVEESKTEKVVPLMNIEDLTPVQLTQDILPEAATGPAKPAFKPRFKPGVTKQAIVPAEETQTQEPAPEPPAKNTMPAPTEPIAPVPADAPKPAYKPRFSPKMAKPKPPEEDNTGL